MGVARHVRGWQVAGNIQDGGVRLVVETPLSHPHHIRPVGVCDHVRHAPREMGITGLLPFLRGIQREVHVSSFGGRSVAVDAYCWLHKGAYACATQLVVRPERLETL